MKLRLPLAVAPGVDLDDAETWPEVHVCDAKSHEPRFATARLHLVDGPIDYCADCAAQMKAIYAALGAHAHEEPIALPSWLSGKPARAIALEGVKP